MGGKCQRIIKMAISNVAIHPKIGIARVGDSEDDFFIGPERPREKPDPQGGFKDDQCRIKRQGARFRIFATYDDGTVEELTDEDADITWSVHLANKKAAMRTQPGTNDQLTIDPGAESVDGPNERAQLDTGEIEFIADPSQGYPNADTVEVPLGEIRTDTDGRLIVLGGYGDAESPTGESLSTGTTFHTPRWYDDTSDGPVTATVELDSGETFDEDEVDGGWVVVGPPKFAPELDNVITLYDRLLHLMVTEGYVSDPWASSDPSYTDDVYPFLERAQQSRWVANFSGMSRDIHEGPFRGSGGSWSHSVTDRQSRQYIFSRLTAPGDSFTDMPDLKEGSDRARLPGTHYDMMRKWKDGDFTDDWPGSAPEPPADITPEGLDEAALENCVGGAFYVGIEVGGLDPSSSGWALDGLDESPTIPILDPDNYASAFRIDHDAVEPGDLTRFLAIPWQKDFAACGTGWWPVPRPNQVLPQSLSTFKNWDRHASSSGQMVRKWSDLGFVLEQDRDGADPKYVEVDVCDPALESINLLTPSIDFGEVPRQPMGGPRKTARAIKFEVQAPSSTVSLSVDSDPDHPRLSIVETPGPISSTTGVETARFWLRYETASSNEVISDTVTITDGSQSWTIDVDAATVGRREAATALVLDRSGSMDEDRGDGTSKHESLVKAASIFVDVMLEGDAVSIVRYNQDASVLKSLTTLGPPPRPSIETVLSGSGLTPDGRTSIGDGIFEGRQSLPDPSTSRYDVTSLVVLTDGKENEPRSIADVAGAIDEQTYSVGLGKPSNTSAPALQTISGNTGGYLLVTGTIGSDEQFILRKYFLQILSGVSNAEVVLDPEGRLTRGDEHRIPFELTDADTGLDVILLTDEPEAVDFRLETPNGTVIEPWRAEDDPGMDWVLSDGVTYFRLSLPVELLAEREERGGEWHALLGLGGPRLERDEQRGRGRNRRDHREDRERDDRRSSPEAYRHGAARDDVDANRPTDRPVRTSRAATGRAMAAASFESYPEEGTELAYSLLVHAYSNLTMDAELQQSGYEPGDDLRLSAWITESGIPVGTASVWAEVTRPDGNTSEVQLEPRENDRYGASITASSPGVYRTRIRARGETRRGRPFQRAQVVTGAVWHGGDRDAAESQSGGRAEPDLDVLACDLLECLAEDAFDEERLAELGVDLDVLRECATEICRRVDHDGTAETVTATEQVGTPEHYGEFAAVADQLRSVLDDMGFTS